MFRTPISACVIALNEERCIGACLDSRKICDEIMLERGKHTSALRLFRKPTWRFLRAYILKRGYLDGWRGFVIAQIEANHVREKYLRLYIAERAPRYLSSGTTQIE